MFGPHLFDAYVRDGLTGQTLPIPRNKTAAYPAIYVSSGKEYEGISTPFCDREGQVFLEFTHRTDRGESLPDGLEARILERKGDMVKVWFEKRGVYIVHTRSISRQENWGRVH